jgi:elongator complex protein 3
LTILFSRKIDLHTDINTLEMTTANTDDFKSACRELLDMVLDGTITDELQLNKQKKKISGVAVIAAMTSPAPCPHGVCVPCPGGPDSSFASPQSYMGREPATMRAIQNEYDPYRQVTSRLTQLKTIGHEIDKAELIVMGGTFSARSIDYQEWFTKRCIEAMNDFYDTDWRNNVPPGSGISV